MSMKSVGIGLCALAATMVVGNVGSVAQAAEGESPQVEKKGTNVTTGAENARVVIETSLGTIKAELWADKAPGTVANFLKYTDDKFFDGLIFHRVISGFMIQGGGFSPDMRQKRPAYPAIKNEARSDVKNVRGTLAMARTGVIDSAMCQFFINLLDNGALDHEVRDFGYCVFGKVTEGMDVVDAIAKVATGEVNGMKDVPLEPVTIKNVRRDQPVAATK
jgi:peptidyl-prolyl cis-trans isomerase A (cyclophilin A)